MNGKSAIEWIMERYKVTIDKKSGIKNEPNDWADEVGTQDTFWICCWVLLM